MASSEGQATRAGQAGQLRYAVGSLVVLVAVLGVLVNVSANRQLSTGDLWFQVESLTQVIVLAVAGVLILRYRPARAVGWVLLASSLVWAVSFLLSGVALTAAGRGWAGASLLALLGEAIWPLELGVPLVLLPQVYPDGPLPDRRFRRVLLLTVAALAVDVVLTAVTVHVFGVDALGDPRPPLGFEVAYAAHVVLWLGSILAAGTVLALRWRRATALVRQQIGMLCLTLTATLALLVVSAAGLVPSPAVDIVWTLWSVAVVASIGWGVLRHNLYDVRVVVRRAAVYGGLTLVLTALFVAVYFAVLALVARGLSGGGLWWAAALAAVAVVCCAEPGRRRLQALVERRILGERGRPLRALALLSDSSDGDEQALLDAACRTVAAAVRAPGVDLSVHRSGRLETVARTGENGSERVVVPLLHRGERLGELRLSPRTPGEPYGRADHALLHRLADQVAGLVYGLRRDAELAAARQQALTVGLEERSRLGRDLHDGLGPLLAGAGLAAEALRRGMVPGSADEAEAAQLAQRLRHAATEVRRVAHGLQPGAPEQGLVAALTDHVATLAGPGVPTVEVRADLPPLPPSVEQAAYLVILEALANVVRHARAAHVEVTLAEESGGLVLAVRDDGVGIAVPYVSGLGITSMRNRVQTLGGSITVQAGATCGTVVRATIPVLA